MNIFKHFINGQWIDSSGDSFIKVENPYTGQVIAKVSAANEADVNLAVEGAKDAFLPWKETPVEKRVAIIQKAYDYFIDHQDEIINTIIDELGSVVKLTKTVHFGLYMPNIQDYIDLTKNYKFVEKFDGYEVHKEPIGIVACITPWNFPFGQIVKKVIPALLMGNTVILKPSQKTPLTALYFAHALEYAGLPKGVFQLVNGRGSEVGNILAKHNDVNMISFTGSTSGGKELMSLGVKSIKRHALELGGKSASIYLGGNDFDAFLKASFDEVFLNAGQACSSKTRLLLPRSIKDQARETIIKIAKNYKYGDPRDPNNDYGPVQTKEAFEKIISYIDYGKKHFDILFEGEVDEKHRIIGPVIFDDVDNKSKIAQEEIFGPVLCIIYYDDIDKAIELANDSIYGLHAMVWGPKDLALKVASRLNVGQVKINNGTRTHNAPFGGYKQSGIGREGSIFGLEEYLELKTLFI